MIFDAVHEWIKLKKELPQLFAESYYKDKFAKGTPAFAIAAYMIHPIYRGKAGLKFSIYTTTICIRAI